MVRSTGQYSGWPWNRAREQAYGDRSQESEPPATFRSMTAARPRTPRVRMDIATPEDIPGIVAVRVNAAEDLTERFGGGHWSGHATDRGVAWDMRQGKVLVARRGKSIVGTLKIATRKPWAIDVSYFTQCKHPWYLTNMAVDPAHQGLGIGTRCVMAAMKAVREEGGDAVRLDAYDAEAGAGAFYEKCGFTERGRVTYRITPLVYYEKLLTR
jgi:ribosomal protein S18 acetylase RimI-like enzyme